jgi:hypothetical protein
MRLTVEERVFILKSYLKTMYCAHCRQSSLKNLEADEDEYYSAIVEVNERTLRKVARNIVKSVDKCIEMNGHNFQHLL